MACITKKKNKPGRWCIDFYDQYGKRRLKVLPEGTTKADAKEVLREIEDEVGKGIFMPSKKIPTFCEVAKDWIEHKRLNLRESTWEVYEGHVRNHFHDLNELKIKQITIATLEKFIRIRQEKGMNIATLRKILVSLGQILSYAVRHRYIDHNPLRDADRPRGQGDEAQGQDDMAILTPAQINALLNAVKNPNYRMLYMLAIFSGARQGELLGLKWGDVDWANNQIHIQRTFNNRRFFLPKTKTSNRKIDLGPNVMAALRRWRLMCPPNELNLVFPSRAGTPLDRCNMVNRHFYPALKEANLPKIRFHDLRHTYASLLIEQGENIKYIQTQLGHSNPTMTWNVYAHLMKPTNRESACKLENAIFGANGDQMETKDQFGETVDGPKFCYH
jgi:integrase